MSDSEYDLEYSGYVIIEEKPVPIYESGINTIEFDELKKPSKMSYDKLAEFLLQTMKRDEQERKDFTPVKPVKKRKRDPSKKGVSTRRLIMKLDNSDS